MNCLSFEELVDDSGYVHGWLDRNSNGWQARLAFYDMDEEPWYPPSCGEEPEFVGDIHVRLLSETAIETGTLSKKTVHKEFGTISRKRCSWNLPKAHVQFSVLRLHCPEVNSKAKDMENCRFTVVPTRQRLRLVRIIVSANQLSLYGAVAEMCEEYESLHDRSGQPDKVMGQSIVMSEVKTEVPLENDDPAYQNFVLQQYEERIERLTQQDKVSKFCLDAGFPSAVEIGQYSMTKDNGEQFDAMACREYTLPRDDGSRGWIQGNTKIGPVLEVTTSYLHGKYGVEIRIESVNKDNTHSWVRISHGSNKFVMDSNNNDTEVPEDQPEEQALQLNVKDFACRSKAKAKPQRRGPAGYSPSIIPMKVRTWIDIEPGNHSLSLCVRSFEESNPSSSSFSASTTRRGWSGSFLEN